MIEKGYMPTYLRTLHSKLSAIFNYAVLYYKLPINPCRQSGTIGSKKTETIDFWTLDKFKTFIPAIADKPRADVGINILYWSGIRIGELLALLPPDIIKKEDNYFLNIYKTWQIVEGKEVIEPPKSDNGIRIVPIPLFLGEEIEKYMGRLYECSDSERFI